FGLDFQSALDEVDRLVETFAAFGQHVAEVVERRRVLGIASEELPEQRLGFGVALLLVENGAELEDDRRLLRKLALRILEHLDSLAAAIRVRVVLRQCNVGRWIVA